MRFRKAIFWIHLCTGIGAGIVIGIMCFTGVMLAFEKDIIAWAERDARRVIPPIPVTLRLPLDNLLAKVREAQPGARPSGITLWSDPGAAVLVSLGRTNSFHLNPYTGALQPQAGSGVRQFMRVMMEWHRYLGGHDERRTVGKAITAACNVAFLFLATSGLYLWWPRQWTRNILRGIAIFNFKLGGKARDWNWHNVLGLWCAPVLIVLTTTAMPISYRWAGDLIYKLTGSEPPPTRAGPGGMAPAVEIAQPAPGVKALDYEALIAAVQQQSPKWEQITVRLDHEGPRSGTSGSRGGPPAVTVSVKERGGGPRFATALLTLDPFTAAVLREESYAGYNVGRQVRSWTRFLHTGEAFGPVGQAVAGIASLGGLFLVWTGFALALRRFFQRKAGPETDSGAPTSDSAEARLKS